MALQLDFFLTEEQCELSDMRFQIDKIRSSSEKVRKKLFAENGHLKQTMIELQDRLAIIERHICQGVQN